MNATPTNIREVVMTRYDVPPAFLSVCDHCDRQIMRVGRDGEWSHVITDHAGCSDVVSVPAEGVGA